MALPMFSRVLLSLGAAFVVSAAASQGVDYRVVALTGDPVPGLRDGVYISGFGRASASVPQIADDGSVCFLARLSGSSVSEQNDRALCIADRDGSIRMLLRKGQQAPGLPFGTFIKYINSFRYGRNGVCGIRVDYTDRSGEWTPDDYGVYVIDDDDIRYLARPGDPFIGGLPGDVYGGLGTPLDGPGDGGFAVRSIGDPSEVHVLSISRGESLVPIAQTGDQVPVFGPGIQLGFILFPQYYGPGQVLFRTELQEAGVPADNSLAFCLASEAGIEPIFRQGQPVPGEPGGDLSFESASISSDTSGRALLAAGVQGSGVNIYNENGLWLRHADGTLTKVVREGDPAPLIGPDAVFKPLIQGVLDGAGKVVFIASAGDNTLNEPRDLGLWRGASHTDLELLLREGDPAPGATEGETVGHLPYLWVNRVGQFVLTCWFQGDDVNTSNNEALYMLSQIQELVLVLREAETYDVGRTETDMRQLKSLTTVNNVPPFDYATVLNNRNELAQHVEFQDGSQGVLVISLDDGCTADTNGDGSLTPTDFTAWINAFNNRLPECDQNGDGACTPTDFTAWIANYNAGCP